MKLFLSSKQVALVAVVSLSAAGLTMSAAAAMPTGYYNSEIGGTGTSSMVQKTASDQHRIYPGSDTVEVKKARAARSAPNLYCDKHENECE